MLTAGTEANVVYQWTWGPKAPKSPKLTEHTRTQQVDSDLVSGKTKEAVKARPAGSSREK